MEKRMAAIFCVIILISSLIMFRIYYVSFGAGYAQVASEQGSYVLTVSDARGMIYDCNLAPLVNQDYSYMAAVVPLPESTAALLELYPNRDEIVAHMEDKKPFVLAVEGSDIYANGIDIFKVSKRYAENQLAPHIIGHLSGGEGVYGIESSFNDYLKQNSSKIEIRYSVDAAGNVLTGKDPQIIDTRFQNEKGVVLTIDGQIQQITEYAAKKYLTKGAVVVMDCQTGDLKAVVSLPEFDPNDVAASINDESSPFINRAFSQYNVGSTFKLAVAAAALEEGFTTNRSYTCTGSIDIGGQVFNCGNKAGHGYLTMQHALEVSCNPYFISLATELGADKLLEYAANFGFGRSTAFAENYSSAAGYLPAREEITGIADLANLGFGQGKLMATPVQIASLVAAIANGGSYVRPRLVLGYSDETATRIAEELPSYGKSHVISEETAEIIRELMVSVVENGSGKNAMPEVGSAGGKTASAQTGTYLDDEGEVEKVEAWFSGFFPAENPQYVIVVLAEGGESGGTAAAPVFKTIADSMYKISKVFDK